MNHKPNTNHLLYHPSFEHDSCGVGFVANINGTPSHWILEKAVEAVVNLTHRGAVDADAKTGDGAGILTQIPFKFFQSESGKLGFPLVQPGSFGVGMVFFPREDAEARTVLTGEANDYVGKSMAGGEIVVRPSADARYASHENTIIGNTVMYGATGGTLFAAGQAGERFCVRNSGGESVVEGIGDHGCEYMTGGTVVVLGRTGRNFAAGMTGGVAFILDEDHDFEKLYNPQLVGLERISDAGDIMTLQSLTLRHQALTHSLRAQEILHRWDYYLPMFWKVVPHPGESLPPSKPTQQGELRAPVATR